MSEYLTKVGIPEPKKINISPIIIDAIFLGYSLDSSINRFLVTDSKKSGISNNTLIENRDATYFKNIFPSRN